MSLNVLEIKMISAFKLISLLTFLCGAWGLPNPSTSQEDPVVTKFRTYLRFKSAHPNPEPGYGENLN